MTSPMPEIRGVVKIAITLTDGTLIIMHFLTIRRDTPDGPEYVVEASDANINWEIEKWKESSPDAAPILKWRKLRQDEVPTDRTYRNALRDDDTALTHDMVKAREIAVQRIRDARVQEFAKLDVEWMKAVAQEDKVAAAAIEAQRQTLRDLPADTEALLADAATIKEMEAKLQEAKSGTPLEAVATITRE